MKQEVQDTLNGGKFGFEYAQEKLESKEYNVQDFKDASSELKNQIEGLENDNTALESQIEKGLEKATEGLRDDKEIADTKVQFQNDNSDLYSEMNQNNKDIEELSYQKNTVDSLVNNAEKNNTIGSEKDIYSQTEQEFESHQKAEAGFEEDREIGLMKATAFSGDPEFAEHDTKILNEIESEYSQGEKIPTEQQDKFNKSEFENQAEKEIDKQMFTQEQKDFGKDLEDASNALKEVKEDMNKMSSEITDEMRLEQSKLETSLRKDGSDSILQPDSSIAKAEEIKQEYIQDSYKEYAKNNISSDEKTQEAYSNYMMTENQANLESKNSLEVIDNEITKSTINSKEDFENHLDIKESALNSVKDYYPEKTVEINKQLDDIKEIKESLNDKEQDISTDNTKDADKSVEPAKDVEKDADVEKSGFLDSAKDAMNNVDLMADSRESDSAFDRGFAEAMDNWDKSLENERREEFDSSIER